MDGSEPRHGRTGGDPRHRVLGKRRREDPLRAEPIGEALGGALDPLVVVHVEAHDEDGRVPIHLLDHGFAQGLDITDDPATVDGRLQRRERLSPRRHGRRARPASVAG